MHAINVIRSSPAGLCFAAERRRLAARAAGHRWQDAECEQQFVTGSQGCKRAGGGDSMSFSGESVCSAKTDDWWVICFALLSVWQGLV